MLSQAEEEFVHLSKKHGIKVESCMSLNTLITNQPNEDDIYAYALSKTLTKVSSPVTVGLYSSCQSRTNAILEQIQVYMDWEALRIEEECKERLRPCPVKLSVAGFFVLICRMLFYNPIWTKENQQYHNIRFIHVHFSAWHFAGSDLLWAGIAIRLFQAMQMDFGKLKLVLYRVAQHDDQEEIKEKIVTDGPNNWSPKKVCCCPLWFLVLFSLVVPVIILVFLLIYVPLQTHVTPGSRGNETNRDSMLEGLVIAAFGVPAVSALRFIFRMGKNLIFSLEKNIKKGMDNGQLSSQLGFMNEVRKEIWFISRFIEFMEVFERRKIRVVLNITSLDRCSNTKIVAVLDAINILLSEKDSPFISILAVNPNVLVEKVNSADSCVSKGERAHALLNHIVTLAFTVPPRCDDSKCDLFQRLTGLSKATEYSPMRHSVNRENKSSLDGSLVEVSSETQQSTPLDNKDSAALDVTEEEENLFWSLMTSNQKNLKKYMLDDAMSMRRVINSIRLTVIIMKALKKELPQPEYVAAWVLLANQWPCRLSWIIQCVEDAQQSSTANNDEKNVPNTDPLRMLWKVFSKSEANTDTKNVADTDPSKLLWDVFADSREELSEMRAQIEDLLEQDGDPEMFESFLKEHFRFTINDLKTFEVTTVNLDHSIRTELAKIRGISRLKDSARMKNDSVPITLTISMTTEDIHKVVKTTF